MLAYVVREPGHAGLERVPVPEPSSGQVLLRVRATALNRKDLFLRGGSRGPGMRPVRYPSSRPPRWSGRSWRPAPG
ncbi:hypothetical protein [Cellulomonas sp. ATA003]|uniref:hypothetical protein n=1 Tax=Cellulomonas sp. ATA003 TaxID=3073064 RepID=UPI002873257B|nr:hypothetical protein [Cellulomonas sp. ATA003]WNB86505.1 hypothetical protein REH70_04520 [Cellulomonas sp. ATA003]